MKRCILLKSLSFSLALLLFALMGFSAFAEESGKEDVIAQKREMLIEKGLPEDMVSLLEKSELFSLANSDAMQFNIFANTVDELQSIEYYANADAQQLTEDGFSAEQISEVFHNLSKLRSLTDDEFAAEYALDKQEIKLVRMALAEGDVNPVYIENDDLVTSSGSIGTNTLEIAALVENMSTDKDAIATIKKVIAKEQKVIYTVGAVFNWKRPPLWLGSTDHVALYWNKSLSATAYSGLIIHYDQTYNKYTFNPSPSYKAYPGYGAVYSFNTTYSSSSNKIYSGLLACYVFEERAQNLTAQLVVRYEHSRPGITGGSMSINSGGVIGIGLSAQLLSDFSVENNNTSAYFSI